MPQPIQYQSEFKCAYLFSTYKHHYGFQSNGKEFNSSDTILEREPMRVESRSRSESAWAQKPIFHDERVCLALKCYARDRNNMFIAVFKHLCCRWRLDRRGTGGAKEYDERKKTSYALVLHVCKQNCMTVNFNCENVFHCYSRSSSSAAIREHICTNCITHCMHTKLAYGVDSIPMCLLRPMP